MRLSPKETEGDSVFLPGLLVQQTQPVVPVNMSACPRFAGTGSAQALNLSAWESSGVAVQAEAGRKRIRAAGHALPPRGPGRLSRELARGQLLDTPAIRGGRRPSLPLQWGSSRHGRLGWKSSSLCHLVSCGGGL